MKIIIAFAIAMSVVAIYTNWPDNTPNGQAVVAMPRAELYSSLNDLFSEIERKAATAQTVTGRPPYPVTFSFDRDDGEMLSMSGVAGFREVHITAWIEDGEKTGESLLKVQFKPVSLLEKSGEEDAYRALTTTLKRTSAQFIDGHRITALFGEGAESRADDPNKTSWDEMHAGDRPEYTAQYD